MHYASLEISLDAPDVNVPMVERYESVEDSDNTPIRRTACSNAWIHIKGDAVCGIDVINDGGELNERNT
jgi:hypothetical protein